MVNQAFKLFFKVVETYEAKGYLVLVSDRTDSGLARQRETIELRCAGKSSRRCQAGIVKFWRLDNSREIPLCLAVKGLKPEEVPIGSEVWIEESHPIQTGRRRFEYVGKPVGDAPTVFQDGNGERTVGIKSDPNKCDEIEAV
ncbi:hypothetical protein KBI23_11255 [bacterium]|nr:hypothetical protein [bacterium]MBP9809216.1 hypothetical protein [bacterium]